ncbi:MAG: hypothetical protein O7J95_09510 [Planctomycetota bacterium]|nr:hypothetical protein [Planctomycetota bacterium]
MHRPPSITVFGILNIVLGVLGIVAPFVSNLLSRLVDPKDNPVLQVMQENEAFQAYENVTTVIGIVMSLVLLFSGVGLLRLRPAARVWTIVYAYFALIYTVVNVIASYFVLLRPMMDQMNEMEPREQAIVKFGMFFGLVGGTCFALIYPILLLIFMNRRPARVAFGLEKEIYDDDEDQDGMRHEPYEESDNPYESP